MDAENEDDSQNSEKVRGLFSFSLKKKKEIKTLKVSSIAEPTNFVKEKTDFIVSVNENKIESTEHREEKKELVIPLITKNKWHGHEGSPQGELQKRSKPVTKLTKNLSGESYSGLDKEAVQAIMKDTRNYNETWDERDKENPNLTIPLLMVNKPPEGFETDEKLDVSIRPDEADEADYDQVPISSFGMALLKGMGFNEREGIGNKMKKVVAPVEAVSRPKGQGLGAERGPAKNKPSTKGKDTNEEDEAEGFLKGSGVLVINGPHKNLYGLIEGVDEDNARLMIKLALGGQMVTISQFSAQSVSRSEYKQYSKDLGKFSKGHSELKRKKDKKEENTRDREDESRKDKYGEEKHRSHDQEKNKGRGDDCKSERYSNSERKLSRDKEWTSTRDKGRDSQRKESREGSEENRKSKYDRKERNDRENGENKKRQRLEDRETSHDHSSYYWLRPDLRVRFISKNFKGGRYYNVKVKVVDVQERDVCSCRTDEGILLEDIKQSMLETLIPRTEPGYVMVVQGRRKGQVGTILDKDKRKCEADVQMLRDRDQIIRFSYDSICEYVGDMHIAEDL